MQGCEVFCKGCFESIEMLPSSLIPIRKGNCPWCGTRNTGLYAMSGIADRFRELIALYKVADSFEDGPNDVLYRMLYHDWGLFSEQLMAGKIKDLVGVLSRCGLDEEDAFDIVGSEELVKPIDDHLCASFRDVFYDHVHERFWERFADPSGPPVSWYDAFIEDMAAAIPQSQLLFRARIYDKNLEKEPFTREQMKAPPADKVRPGRSNKIAQRTLYCADDLDTCISEVRPFKGAGVAVSELKLQREARVIDFCDPRWIVSPLRVDNISWLVQTRGVLEHVAYLFSIPANTGNSDLYYEPTQALCDSLRVSGYDGIKYRSSLGPGANYTFFDPEIGIPDEPECHWVEEIAIRHTDVEPFDLENPEHPYADSYRRAHL